jgi:hypothetical protein
MSRAVAGGSAVDAKSTHRAVPSESPIVSDADVPSGGSGTWIPGVVGTLASLSAFFGVLLLLRQIANIHQEYKC